MTRIAAGLIAASGFAAALHAQTNFPEVEPNDTKGDALANGPFELVAGDSVSGITTGAIVGGAETANPDYFLIRTTPLPPGIYRHRLILTSEMPGHTITIRGLDQIPAPAGPWPGPVGIPGVNDVQAQAAAIGSAARISQWYGFGREEQVFYRIDGTTNTTSEYIAVLESSPVAAADIGTFQAGIITISTFGQGHTTDTDLWVYNEALEAIHGYGNDGGTTIGGAPANTLTPSFLRREYEAGIYYLAITNYNLANSRTSPCDDQARSDTILDFPDAVLCSSSSAGLNVSFTITDSAGPTPVTASKTEAFDIVWVKFTVTGTLGTGACCFEDGTCEIESPLICTNLGGTYRGDGTQCATANCPQPGGCCFHDGSCQLLSATQCAAYGAIFAGAGVSCLAAGCAQPGACCLPGYTCQVLSESQCNTAGGTYLGNETPCSQCPPAPTGACCLLNGSCEVMTGAACHAAAGAYRGDEVSCETHCHTAYAYTGAAVAIPDGTGNGVCGLAATMEIVVDEPMRVEEADAAFRIEHTWQGDVKVVLTHVNTGRSAVLMNRPGVPATAFGFSEDNFGTATTPFRVRPEAAKAYGPPDVHSPGIADVSGSWKAPPGLSVFAGARAAGLWRLEVFDCAEAYTGTLRAFTLSLLLDPTTACYANCDGSTSEPLLTVDDFTCFINAYAIALGLPHEEQIEHYANCDGSTAAPVLTVDDFTCFIDSFASGCM